MESRWDVVGLWKFCVQTSKKFSNFKDKTQRNFTWSFEKNGRFDHRFCKWLFFLQAIIRLWTGYLRKFRWKLIGLVTANSMLQFDDQRDLSRYDFQADDLRSRQPSSQDRTKAAYRFRYISHSLFLIPIEKYVNNMKIQIFLEESHRIWIGRSERHSTRLKIWLMVGSTMQDKLSMHHLTGILRSLGLKVLDQTWWTFSSLRTTWSLQLQSWLRSVSMRKWRSIVCTATLPLVCEFITSILLNWIGKRSVIDEIRDTYPGADLVMIGDLEDEELCHQVILGSSRFPEWFFIERNSIPKNIWSRWSKATSRMVNRRQSINSIGSSKLIEVGETNSKGKKWREKYIYDIEYSRISKSNFENSSRQNSSRQWFWVFGFWFQTKRKWKGK